MAKKKGFTLIELLVVIAIIALLLAILMPSLKKVKGVARNVMCRSNLRQWGLIWRMYTNNYDSKFPKAKLKGTGWHRGAWIVPLRNEWQSRGKILLCPSASKIDKDASSAGGLNFAYRMGDSSSLESEEEILDKDAEYCSYGMNIWALDADGTGSVQGRPEADHWTRMGMGNSNTVPLFLDSVWRGGGPQYGGGDAEPALENGVYRGAGYEMSHFTMDRHSGGVNSLFMDLTVNHVPVKQLWRFKWHRSFNTQGYEANNGDWSDPKWEWIKQYKEY